MAQIDIDKFVISLRRCFGENKGIATTLDRCLFSLGLKYVDTPTGGRLERVDQPTMLEKIMCGSGEQKSAWSKEDNDKIYQVLAIVDDYRRFYTIKPSLRKALLNDLDNIEVWLKSLKDKVHPQPKPDWSEEDEDMLYKATAVINRLCAEGKEYVWSVNTLNKLFYWFKSLKDRVQPQPQQQWSEEDEDIKDSIIHQLKMLRGDRNVTEGNKKEIEWLQSLRPQSHWKPSEEQINALNYVVNLMASSERPTENDLYYNILKSLRQQLKKLKG